MASTKDMVVTLALSRSGRLVVSERKERGLEGEGQGVRVSARCALSCPRPLWERAAPAVDKECWGEGLLPRVSSRLSSRRKTPHPSRTSFAPPSPTRGEGLRNARLHRGRRHAAVHHDGLPGHER